MAAPSIGAQTTARMRPVPAAERREVQVGAGTQGDATTGSSGPQKEGSQEGSAAGSLSSAQPGGGSGGGGPAPSGARGGRP